MKRTALRVLVVSVVVSAAMGCWALLFRGWSDLQGRILVSSLVVTGASLLAMACGAASERRAMGPLPPVGIALALLDGVLVIAGIWTEVGTHTYWKACGTLAVAAVATSHAAMLGIPKLPARVRWVGVATYLLDALLTVVLAALIWSEGWEGDAAWRLVGVLSVLLCAGTVLVPVLKRVSAPAEQRSVLDVRFCPACGAPILAPSGRGRCAACGAAFEVRPA